MHNIVDCRWREEEYLGPMTQIPLLCLTKSHNSKADADRVNDGNNPQSRFHTFPDTQRR